MSLSSKVIGSQSSIYTYPWQRAYLIALLGYVRDVLVAIFPPMPRLLLKVFYGANPHFVFFVHPRRSEDIYKALPFIKFLRKVFSKRLLISLFSNFPPFVIGEVVGPNGINGLIVSSLFLPDILVKRKKSLCEARRGLRFSRKVAGNGAAVGLGGWWPSVTRQGTALRSYAEQLGVSITTGHCGTLVSLYMTLKRVALLGNIPLSDLRVSILGVGKMGSSLAKVLYGEIAHLGLIDLHRAKLLRTASQLQAITVGNKSHTNIQAYVPEHISNQAEYSKFLAGYHVIVITASNLRRIIRPELLPRGAVVIDDSRPEAMSRALGSSDMHIVIEGGLLRIPGIRVSYDFGFGVTENVFGCLGEAFILASESALQPTLWEVDVDNFASMMRFCKNNGITEGDFKFGVHDVTESIIAKMLQVSSERIAQLEQGNLLIGPPLVTIQS